MKLNFNIENYLNKLRNSNDYFYTFINRNSLSVGVLLLKPNDVDTQEPHDSDEIYYIISGSGFLEINKKSYPVKSGSIHFVAKNTPHHFFGNSENLIALYFFGGPDS